MSERTPAAEAAREEAFRGIDEAEPEAVKALCKALGDGLEAALGVIAGLRAAGTGSTGLRAQLREAREALGAEVAARRSALRALEAAQQGERFARAEAERLSAELRRRGGP